MLTSVADTGQFWSTMFPICPAFDLIKVSLSTLSCFCAMSFLSIASFLAIVSAGTSCLAFLAAEISFWMTLICFARASASNWPADARVQGGQRSGVGTAKGSFDAL
jgi:hypothetical protein